MLDGGDYTPEMTTETFSGMTGFITTTNKNKRRFSDEQIKSLELMFESETRLEPSKKLEVAKGLGLHPRQVAIWFQNKRARSKSKQLEHDYTILQENYNILASKLESVKKEKHALLVQLQKLNDLVKKPKEEGQCCEQVTTMNSNKHGHGGVVSDDDSATKMEEEHNLKSMLEEVAAGSWTSSDDWRSFESDCLFDQSSSSSSYPWLDFWC